MRTFVPGKVILTGEYGALFDAPTLVLALNPPYEIQDVDTGSSRVTSGLGPGFGSSTCHFWMRHKRQLPLKLTDVQDLRRIFRDECASDQVRPSGVDIAAQLFGGAVLVVGEDIFPTSIPSHVLSQCWMARPKNLKKVDTQQALSSDAAKALVYDKDFEPLRIKWAKVCEAFISAIPSGDWGELSAYQSQIEGLAQEAQVIAPEVIDLLNAARHTPGVGFIKGCGALFQDVFVMQASAEARAQLKDKFEFIGKLSDHFTNDGILSS